jgi:tetratricopeptide (TPR) repeat protein
MNMRRHAALFSVLGLVGCAAAFVPATNDPQEKLKWAGGLIHKAARPLPAESLIQEAVATFQQQNDELGLADAYRIYGSFFSAPAIEKWHRWYAEHGFRDKSATLENRYWKSIEYFEKARDIYTRYERFDRLTYVNLNMGLSYELLGDLDAACRAYERSAESKRENARYNPEAKIVAPERFATYEDVLAFHKQRAQCK